MYCLTEPVTRGGDLNGNCHGHGHGVSFRVGVASDCGGPPEQSLQLEVGKLRLGSQVWTDPIIRGGLSADRCVAR
jgi:hypothetical protein